MNIQNRRFVFDFIAYFLTFFLVIFFLLSLVILSSILIFTASYNLRINFLTVNNLTEIANIRFCCLRHSETVIHWPYNDYIYSFILHFVHTAMCYTLCIEFLKRPATMLTFSAISTSLLRFPGTSPEHLYQPFLIKSKCLFGD